MKLVSVYNRYLNRGGEDEVFESEGKLLAEHGCRVRLVAEQLDVPGSSAGRISLALNALWSRKWHRKFRSILLEAEPDVVHVHNFFPVFSPSIYYASKEVGLPVVQTLHNYRLLCPGKILFHNGRVCEECLGRSPWRGVLHACYRDSRAATAATALMLSVHRWLGTWSKIVDCYIALTEFGRAKFIEGGLPAEKIVVKPNFVYPDPMADGDQESGVRSQESEVRRQETEVRSQESQVRSQKSGVRSQEPGGSRLDSAIANPKSPIANPERRIPNPESQIPNPESRPTYALFVGRLSPEKGVRTLVAAWQRLGNGIPLRVVGDGPLRAELEAQVSRLGLSRVWRGKPAATSISFHGRLTPDHVTPVMKRARFLVFPSEWYEGMPRTIIEAFACGVPVIASRLGAMQEIVEDGRTGLHFTPGDADDLAAKVEWAWTHPDEMQEMGCAARAEYEFKYTAERNYQMLMGIYQRVLGARC